MTHRLQALSRVLLLFLAALLLGGTGLVALGDASNGAIVLETPGSDYKASSAIMGRDHARSGRGAAEMSPDALVVASSARPSHFSASDATTGNDRLSRAAATIDGQAIPVATTAAAASLAPAGGIPLLPPSIGSRGRTPFGIIKPDEQKTARARIMESASRGGLSLPPALSPA